MRTLTRSRLRDDIVRELSSLIATGELAGVERLKEVELAAKLGVSRTPLREALLILEREGLVESEVNKGFRVAAVSETRVRELYPILASLEGLAVRDGGPALRARAGELRAVNAELRRSRGAARRHALDRRFHELLWSGSANTTLVDMIRRLWLRAQQFDGAAERGLANFEGSLREHAAIADAIGHGDHDTAASRVEAHWRAGIDVVIGWLRRTTLVPLAVTLLVALGCGVGSRAATSHRAAPLASSGPRPAPATSGPRLVPATCPVPVGAGAVECYTLRVPARRDIAGSATLELPVVRFRSRASRPGAPVVFLGGGPGGSVIGARLARHPDDQLLAGHDFVLFQQRGTRFTTPVLDCPGWNAAHLESFRRDEGPAEVVARQRAAVGECARELMLRGVDLDAYDTAAIAADLLDVRAALGVSQIDLYAISYGTRVALEAIRLAPSVIHAAVLDSVLPPDVRYDEHATENVLRTVDVVLDQCATAPECSHSFPDLRRRWTAALERANRSPIPAIVATVPVRITARHLMAAVEVVVEDARKIPQLPRLLDDISRGDLTGVTTLLADQAQPSSLARGQRLSVWCREEAPLAALAVAHAELGGWSTVAFAPEVCAAWPVTPAPLRTAPVTSAVPTLILAGEYDPITPPAWGRRVRATLARGYVIEVPGASHLAGENACGHGIAAAFLRDPSRLPDISCVARAAPPVFELRP